MNLFFRVFISLCASILFSSVCLAGPEKAGVEFTTEQICKAGLALLYGRDSATMQASSTSDYVVIKYTRPTDAKKMSYRCKLDKFYILTWDESIADARWYGNLPSDTKLVFEVSHGKLLVQDLIKGAINKEKLYTPESLKKNIK